MLGCCIKLLLTSFRMIASHPTPPVAYTAIDGHVMSGISLGGCVKPPYLLCSVRTSKVIVYANEMMLVA